MPVSSAVAIPASSIRVMRPSLPAPSPSRSDQFRAASGPPADIAEHPDRLHRHRQIRGFGRIRQRFGRHRGGQALQRRVEHHRMNPVTSVRSGLVGQDDLGLRRTAGLANDPGQRGERLPVMQHPCGATRRRSLRVTGRLPASAGANSVRCGVRHVSGCATSTRATACRHQLPSAEREWISTRMSSTESAAPRTSWVVT